MIEFSRIFYLFVQMKISKSFKYMTNSDIDGQLVTLLNFQWFE